MLTYSLYAAAQKQTVPLCFITIMYDFLTAGSSPNTMSKHWTIFRAVIIQLTYKLTFL